MFAEESSCYQKNIIPKTEAHIVLHASRVGLARFLDPSWILSLQLSSSRLNLDEHEKVPRGTAGHRNSQICEQFIVHSGRRHIAGRLRQPCPLAHCSFWVQCALCTTHDGDCWCSYIQARTLHPQSQGATPPKIQPGL